jgi:hypothetical protein
MYKALKIIAVIMCLPVIWFLYLVVDSILDAKKDPHTHFEKILEYNSLEYSDYPHLESLISGSLKGGCKLLKVDCNGIPMPKIAALPNKRIAKLSNVPHEELSGGSVYLYSLFIETIIFDEKLIDEGYFEKNTLLKRSSKEIVKFKTSILHEVIHHIQMYRTDLTSYQCINDYEEVAYEHQYRAIHSTLKIRDTMKELLFNKSMSLANENYTCSDADKIAYQKYLERYVFGEDKLNFVDKNKYITR